MEKRITVGVFFLVIALFISMQQRFSKLEVEAERVFSLSQEEFEKLLNSKTFYSSCENFNNSKFFRSKQRTLEFSKGKVSKVFYMYEEDNCSGHMGIIEIEGDYTLTGNVKILQRMSYPTTGINFLYKDYRAKVIHPSLQRRLNIKRLANNFPAKIFGKNKILESFKVTSRTIQTPAYDLIGLGTDPSGEKLFLLPGAYDEILNGRSQERRPVLISKNLAMR